MKAAWKPLFVGDQKWPGGLKSGVKKVWQIDQLLESDSRIFGFETSDFCCLSAEKRWCYGRVPFLDRLWATGSLRLRSFRIVKNTHFLRSGLCSLLFGQRVIKYLPFLDGNIRKKQHETWIFLTFPNLPDSEVSPKSLDHRQVLASNPSMRIARRRPTLADSVLLTRWRRCDWAGGAALSAVPKWRSSSGSGRMKYDLHAPGFCCTMPSLGSFKRPPVNTPFESFLTSNIYTDVPKKQVLVGIQKSAFGLGKCHSSKLLTFYIIILLLIVLLLLLLLLWSIILCTSWMKNVEWLWRLKGNEADLTALRWQLKARSSPLTLSWWLLWYEAQVPSMSLITLRNLRNQQNKRQKWAAVLPACFASQYCSLICSDVISWK